MQTSVEVSQPKEDSENQDLYRQATINIEYSYDDLQGEVNKQLKERQKNFIYPGFRKGKVPISMIDKFFSKEIRSLISGNFAYEESKHQMHDRRLTVISGPFVVKADDFVGEKRISIKLMVEALSQLSLGQYLGLELKKKEHTLTLEEMIERYISMIKMLNVKLEDKSSGISEENDYVMMKFCVKHDGKIIEQKEEHTLQLLSQEKSGHEYDIIRLFLGKAKGDLINQLVILHPDHFNKELAGKEINIEATILGIQKPVQQTQEELMKSYNASSEEEFKATIKEICINNRKLEERSFIESQIIEKLLIINKFSVPQSLIDKEARHIDAKTDEERKRVAESVIKTNIILHTIYERHPELKLEKDFVTGKLQEISMRFNKSPEEINKELQDPNQNNKYLSFLKNSRVMDLIIENAETGENNGQ